MTLQDMLSSLLIILFVIGLFSLAKHDWKNKFLSDKWGVFGIIALLLAIIGCYTMLYVSMAIVFGSDL